MAARHLVWTLTLAGVTAAACGARTGLPVPGDAAVSDAADAAAPGDVPACMGTVLPVEANAPVLYFVLDHSASMSEQDKWPNMRSVIASLLTELGPRARFGAALFPAPGADECGTGLEVMPVQLGDSQGTAASVFLAATSSDPTGGTPTAATIEALTPELTSFPEVTYAILATDGGPNCDPALSCDVSMCTSNMDGVPGCPTDGVPNCCAPDAAGGQGCLDGAQTVQAVAALRSAGVQTFVLGIPGSAPYATVLDDLAKAGGTARASEPLYYSVGTADTAALAGAFAQIVAQATKSCSFELSMAPVDPGEVNVYVDGMVVPQDGPNGWALTGTKLTLSGATCAAVQGSQPQALLVLQGCPTVTR